MFLEAQIKTQNYVNEVKNKVRGYLKNEKGDFGIGPLGWAAIAVTCLVIAHGLITGWLSDFINDKILNRLNTL